MLHVDDDTILPKHFVLDEAKFANPRVSAVSFGIEMAHSNAVQSAVDFELKLFSTFRQLQAHWSTVWFCHGIVGLWRRERLAALLAVHPFLPFGEDGWLGMLNLLNNHQMEMDLRSAVRSFAPGTLLPAMHDRLQGYGASSIWKQRALRWFVNAPRRMGWRVLLMAMYDCGDLGRNVAFRLFSLHHIVRILVVLLVLPMEFVLSLGTQSVSVLLLWLGVVYASVVLEGAMVNCIVWRGRPSMQVTLRTLLLQPLYYQFLILCSVVGHWRCILYYIPFVPMNCRIKAAPCELASQMRHASMDLI